MNITSNYSYSEFKRKKRRIYIALCLKKKRNIYLTHGMYTVVSNQCDSHTLRMIKKKI